MYDERLSVPVRWWLLAALFLASLALAFLVATPLLVAAAATVVGVALTAAVFVGYGGARLQVRPGMLCAGRARIELRHLGEIRELDAAAARRLAGPEADARAFLLLRPYLRRAVRVDIADPADPTPYWLLATRHPDRLAAALVGQTHAHDPSGQPEARPEGGG